MFNDVPALLGYTSMALLVTSAHPLSKVSAWLSGVSYELFLVHILVFDTILHFSKPDGLLSAGVTGIIMLIAAIINAFLYHICVVRMRNHWFKE